MESNAMESIVPEMEAPFHIRQETAHAPMTGRLTMLQSAQRRISSIRYALLKRVLDIVVASIAIVVLFPLGLTIAICIRLTSPGPIFYSERRVGRFGIPFVIFKFRSMYTKEYLEGVLRVDMTESLLARRRTFGKDSADPRITPIGNFLRKWSLDELPQFLNVLLGEMSLVGPRPIVAAERDLYGASGRYYDLAVPGISGLWQVSGRSDISFSERVVLDCMYAADWSLLRDVSILARTFSAVVQKKGAY